MGGCPGNLSTGHKKFVWAGQKKIRYIESSGILILLSFAEFSGIRRETYVVRYSQIRYNQV
jgi:hypothetical protein